MPHAIAAGKNHPVKAIEHIEQAVGYISDSQRLDVNRGLVQNVRSQLGQRAAEIVGLIPRPSDKNRSAEQRPLFEPRPGRTMSGGVTDDEYDRWPQVRSRDDSADPVER